MTRNNVMAQILEGNTYVPVKYDDKGDIIMETFTITQKEMEAAFTEWDRRYREDPEKFTSEAAHLLKETPETYGQAAAPYFLKLLIDLGGSPVPAPMVEQH